MSVPETHNQMKKIDLFLKENSITKNGPSVTTTYSAEIVNGEQIIDMEILLPISDPDKVKEPYTLKTNTSLM